MRRWLLSLGVVLLVLGPVAGEGLLFQLPADGTSVSFDVEMTGMIVQTNKKMLAKGVVTMASVGKETRDGEPCRWIELKAKISQTEPEMQEVDQVVKVLIPEKHAKAGAAPYDHIVKVWRQGTATLKGGKVFEEKLKAVDPKKPGRDTQMLILLVGPYKDAKKLSKQEVDSGLGKLECDGLSGTNTFEIGPETHTVQFENRLHAKAPFGVVALTMKMQAERDGKLTHSAIMTMRLSKVGSGAKSELAEPADE
jgi:hypothetical protein